MDPQSWDYLAFFMLVSFFVALMSGGGMYVGDVRCAHLLLYVIIVSEVARTIRYLGAKIIKRWVAGNKVVQGTVVAQRIYIEFGALRVLNFGRHERHRN
jgi:hypothetical protein